MSRMPSAPRLQKICHGEMVQAPRELTSAASAEGDRVYLAALLLALPTTDCCQQAQKLLQRNRHALHESAHAEPPVVTAHLPRGPARPLALDQDPTALSAAIAPQSRVRRPRQRPPMRDQRPAPACTAAPALPGLPLRGRAPKLMRCPRAATGPWRLRAGRPQAPPANEPTEQEKETAS